MELKSPVSGLHSPVSISKESLSAFLATHTALSARALSIEAGLNPDYITQLYGKSNKPLTDKAAAKLLPVLEKYGYR